MWCSAADEAARKGDVEFRGTTLRIELARGGGPPSMSSFPRGAGRNTRSPYRVLVKGLPPSASWQDVKVKDARNGVNRTLRDGRRLFTWGLSRGRLRTVVCVLLFCVAWLCCCMMMMLTGRSAASTERMHHFISLYTLTLLTLKV